MEKGPLPTQLSVNQAQKNVDTDAEILLLFVRSNKCNWADETRHTLYKTMLWPAGFKSVVDLGDYIIPAEGFKDEHIQELSYLFSEWFEMGKQLVLLSDQEELLPRVYAQAASYSNSPYQSAEIHSGYKHFSQDDLSEDYWLKESIQREDTFLYQHQLLAYQSYFMSDQALSHFDEFGFDYYRLGDIKHKMENAEAAIRSAEVVFFSHHALQAVYSGNSHSNPNGLNGEEACKLTRYCGANADLKFMGFTLADPKDPKMAAFQLAQMLWYFFDGTALAMQEEPLQEDERYLKYEISAQNANRLIFYKSKFSGRWWFYLPVEEPVKYALNKYLVPCSYADYETAMKGQLPNRWIKAAARLEKLQ